MKAQFNFLRKSCLLIGIMALGSQFCWSQTSGVYVPDSATVYMPSGAAAGIWGDTLQLNGRLNMGDSSSLINFKGKVWRNASAAVISSGKVIMNDTALQTIMGGASYSGVSPAFSRLEINNAAGVSLSNGHLRIDSQIVFTQGVLTANNNDLLLGPDASVLQTISSSFANVKNGGGVSKFLNSNMPFVFPVGCVNGAAVYNPLQLNVNASGYNSLSYVRVSMTDSIHNMKSPRHINYGDKFWTVKFRNMTVDSAAYTANYAAADLFQGDQTKVIGSVWANGKWTFKSSGQIAGAALAVTGKIISDADIFGQDRLLQADVKTILQGAWNGTSMNTTLRNNNLIPLAQPYATAPYNITGLNYAGTESRTTLPANAVDWVLLELRSTPAGAAVGRSVGIVLSNGTVVDGFYDGPVEFQNVPDGDYYVIIKHRNHLAIMSAAPVTFPNLTGYDFSAAMAKAWGTGTQMAALGGGKFGMHGGNVNLDASVRASGPLAINDYLKLLNLLGSSVITIPNTYNVADINLNGSVKVTGPLSQNDYLSLLSFLGSSVIIFNQSF